MSNNLSPSRPFLPYLPVMVSITRLTKTGLPARLHALKRLFWARNTCEDPGNNPPVCQGLIPKEGSQTVEGSKRDLITFSASRQTPRLPLENTTASATRMMSSCA
jgi:hypothetical protein